MRGRRTSPIQQVAEKTRPGHRKPVVKVEGIASPYSIGPTKANVSRRTFIAGAGAATVLAATPVRGLVAQFPADTSRVFTRATNSAGEATSALVSGPVAAAIAAAPTCTAVPLISGTVAVGDVLAATNGTWTSSPSSHAYKWHRSGVAISGATAPTYRLQSGDMNETITVKVTAANAIGSARATSVGTAGVLKGLANGAIGVYIPQDGDAGVIAGLESAVGRRINLIMDYYGWDNGTSDIPTVPANTLARTGTRGFMYTLQPSSGPYGATAANCVNWPKLIAGHYDSKIIAFAKWIDTTVRRKFYVRFAHEMNGTGWYDWQVGGSCGVTSAANYAVGFNHFASVLKAHSRFARLVWSPNNGPSDNIASFYPSECNVLGFDAYNFGTTEADWQTDTQVCASAYAEVASCHPTKPIWICETACAEPDASWTYDGTTYGADPADSKATWIKTLFSHSSQYPRVTTLVWFNQQKERNWIMNSSPRSAAAFHKVFANSQDGELAL